MIPLYTKKEYDLSKSQDKLPCKCEYCNNTFYKMKKYISHELKTNKNEIRFCSFSCRTKMCKGEAITTSCSYCMKEIKKQKNAINNSKSGNVFCSKSCATSYNNIHKKHGNRRSKLEIWLEEQLTTLFPNLKILYNNKEIINSELDIYIPHFKLAFELNGIFHYEPIFGSDKLVKIQNNDKRKFQACLENKIELVLIDVSSFGYFKIKNAKKYLDIIINIINLKFQSV